MLWVLIDGTSVLDPPVPAVEPNADPNTDFTAFFKESGGGTAGVFLRAGTTKMLIQRMEKGNLAEFWFAENKKGLLGIGVGLNGFTAAGARARGVREECRRRQEW